jgi:hypothetical protein
VKHLKVFDEAILGLLVGGKMIDETIPDKDSRIKRFQNEYLNKNTADTLSTESGEETNLAEKMFIEDISNLRKLIAEKMLECMRGEFQV